MKTCNMCGRLIPVDNNLAVYGTAVAFCNERHFRRWVKRVDKQDRLKWQ